MGVGGSKDKSSARGGTSKNNLKASKTGSAQAASDQGAELKHAPSESKGATDNKKGIQVSQFKP